MNKEYRGITYVVYTPDRINFPDWYEYWVESDLPALREYRGTFFSIKETYNGQKITKEHAEISAKKLIDEILDIGHLE